MSIELPSVSSEVEELTFNQRPMARVDAIKYHTQGIHKAIDKCLFSEAIIFNVGYAIIHDGKKETPEELPEREPTPEDEVKLFRYCSIN